MWIRGKWWLNKTIRGRRFRKRGIKRSVGVSSKVQLLNRMSKNLARMLRVCNLSLGLDEQLVEMPKMLQRVRKISKSRVAA